MATKHTLPPEVWDALKRSLTSAAQAKRLIEESRRLLETSRELRQASRDLIFDSEVLKTALLEASRYLHSETEAAQSYEARGRY